MALTRRSILPTAALLVAACASAGGGTGSAGRTARWTATLKQPNTSTSTGRAVSNEAMQAQAASYGSLLLTPVAMEGRTRVELTVTAPRYRGAQLAWAVYPGSCSAPTPPVIAATEFPMIDVTNSGSGVVRTEMAFALDPRSSYHVKVYNSSRATDLGNVMVCGSLGYSGPR